MRGARSCGVLRLALQIRGTLLGGQAAPARARQIRELQPIPLRSMVLPQFFAFFFIKYAYFSRIFIKYAYLSRIFYKIRVFVAYFYKIRVFLSTTRIFRVFL